ncbi:MAG: ACT domain-containing protein [Clostridiales bacterium]|nr:ACT domain-containing protein [Clostridiales bacterium]
MELKVLPHALTVCKISDISDADLTSDLFFIGKTDEELSLVCPTDAVPADTIAREDGWRALRIEGILDFALIGILSKITGVLADNNIGIFAVSTYNTDYILVKEADLDKAVAALTVAGYSIVM